MDLSYMTRYNLFFLWSIIVTPIRAQIEQCEILHLIDAVVINEYLLVPCYGYDSTYVEGNHYIYFDGKTVPFRLDSNKNKDLVEHYESDVYIPECLHTYNGDPIVDELTNNYTYELRYSIFYRKRERNRMDSKDIYKRAGKKKLFIAYALDGEIVMYKMKRKIILSKGFKDPIYTLKSTKASKFAVLRKAERLRSLTTEEANKMRLKKVEQHYINLFRPE